MCYLLPKGFSWVHKSLTVLRPTYKPESEIKIKTADGHNSTRIPRELKVHWDVFRTLSNIKTDFFTKYLTTSNAMSNVRQVLDTLQHQVGSVFNQDKVYELGFYGRNDLFLDSFISKRGILNFADTIKQFFWHWSNDPLERKFLRDRKRLECKLSGQWFQKACFEK